MIIKGRKINIGNLVVCGVGVTLFIAVGILPSRLALEEMDASIAKLESEVAQQQTLFPVFIELLRRTQEKSPPLLPAPEPERLARGDTTQVNELFFKIAADNQFQVSSLTPDVESIFDASGRLKMDAVIVGRFEKLHDFLVALGSIPYLEHVEQVRIRPAQDQKGLEISLRFWLMQS